MDLCSVADGTNDPQIYRFKTPGSATKAMRLLGLTTLPSDAIPVGHPKLRKRWSSQALPRSSSSPPPVKAARGCRDVPVDARRHSLSSYSRLATCSNEVETDEFFITGADVDPGQEEWSSGNDEYSHFGVCGSNERCLLDPCLEGKGCWRSTSPVEPMKQHPEHLNLVGESSLTLRATDLDDQFIEALSDLMAQFPKPPLSPPSQIARSMVKIEEDKQKNASGRELVHNRRSHVRSRSASSSSFNNWRVTTTAGTSSPT